MCDVTGLYLDAPDHARVCVDEVSQIQALEWRWSVLPMGMGYARASPTIAFVTASGVLGLPSPERQAKAPGLGLATDRGQLHHAQAQQGQGGWRAIHDFICTSPRATVLGPTESSTGSHRSPSVPTGTSHSPASGGSSSKWSSSLNAATLTLCPSSGSRPPIQSCKSSESRSVVLLQGTRAPASSGTRAGDAASRQRTSVKVTNERCALPMRTFPSL